MRKLILAALSVLAIGAALPGASEARLTLRERSFNWLNPARVICTTCPNDTVYATIDSASTVPDTSVVMTLDGVIPVPFWSYPANATLAAGPNSGMPDSVAMIARVVLTSDSAAVRPQAGVVLVDAVYDIPSSSGEKDIKGIQLSTTSFASNTAAGVAPFVSFPIRIDRQANELATTWDTGGSGLFTNKFRIRVHTFTGAFGQYWGKVRIKVYWYADE